MRPLSLALLLCALVFSIASSLHAAPSQPKRLLKVLKSLPEKATSYATVENIVVRLATYSPERTFAFYTIGASRLAPGYGQYEFTKPLIMSLVKVLRKSDLNRIRIRKIIQKMYATVAPGPIANRLEIRQVYS